MRLEQLSPEVVAIVTDLDGTTVEPAFTGDLLLPYARVQLPTWLAEHAKDAVVASRLDELRAAAREPDADLDRISAIVEQWQADSRRPPSLRALQEMIWQQGLEAGHFTGRICDDAAAALQAWADDRRALFVYASSAAATQRLLFTHSDHGDLSDLFSGYFDTRQMGSKKQTGSYRQIARVLGEQQGALLYLSADGEALDAAAKAGWQTCWIARDDETFDKATGTQAHPIVRHFGEIELI